MPIRRRHYVIGAVAALLVAAAAGVGWWWGRVGEDLTVWREGAPPASWAARDRQETKWREEGSSRHVEHDYRPLPEIGLELQMAVLIGEDVSYLDHGVLDLHAMWEALDEWRNGGRLRGASTITQQLAKSLFLSPERSVWRKAREFRLAWWLEHDLGKARVLELYLNVVEFGPGLLGAEAAARRYFGAQASDLTPEQAAGLAAAIPSPGRDNPATATRRWRARQGVILERMGRAAWLRRKLEAIQR